MENKEIIRALNDTKFSTQEVEEILSYFIIDHLIDAIENRTLSNSDQERIVKLLDQDVIENEVDDDNFDNVSDDVLINEVDYRGLDKKICYRFLEQEHGIYLDNLSAQMNFSDILKKNFK